MQPETSVQTTKLEFPGRGRRWVTAGLPICVLILTFVVAGYFFFAAWLPGGEVANKIWRVLVNSFLRAAPVVGIIGVLAPLVAGMIVAYRRLGVDQVINDMRRLNLLKAQKTSQEKSFSTEHNFEIK